jgi:hypothetical protein
VSRKWTLSLWYSENWFLYVVSVTMALNKSESNHIRPTSKPHSP